MAQTTITDPPLIVLSVGADSDGNPTLEPVMCLRKQEDFYILQEMGYLDDAFPVGSYAAIATLH